MMSARCLCTGSSVVVRDGGGLDDGVSTNTDEDDVIKGWGMDVVVGEGPEVVVGEMTLLINDDDDCALPQPS
jgi:hypothetical protein